MTPKRFDLFLSYNHVDRPFALRLKGALEARGLAVWLDQDEIRPGDLFVSALERGLQESRAIALLVSPESVRSEWVREEYSRALSLTHDAQEPAQLIPAILRGTELPGFLSNRSCVDFRDEAQFEQSVDLLIFGATGEKRKGLSNRALKRQALPRQRLPPTTANSVFEGLFVRLLKPGGDFAADLRAVGYDIEHPRARYPNSVLLASLNVAHRYVYPELSREEAHRRLGRRFTGRYFETRLGRWTRSLVLTLGVERFLMAYPRIVAYIAPGAYAQTQKLPSGAFQIIMRGDSIAADFMAGAIEGATEMASLTLNVQVLRREPEYEWVVDVIKQKRPGGGRARRPPPLPAGAENHPAMGP